MNKQPELPEFWRDLEIAQALNKGRETPLWADDEEAFVEVADPQDEPS